MCQNLPAGLYGFWRDPEANPLSTPTGKLEFYSTEIAKYTPDDPERPPVPHWIEKGVSHDERLSSERANTYPLLVNRFARSFTAFPYATVCGAIVFPLGIFPPFPLNATL